MHTPSADTVVTFVAPPPLYESLEGAFSSPLHILGDLKDV